jgi:type IV pilus assembly protein PilC
MSLEQFLLRRARTASKPHRRVTLDDKMTFFQQLGSLTTAGVPILQALQISAQQTQSERFADILQQVARRVAAGSPLQAALACHRNIFDDHWIALVGTGEASGNMAEVLDDLNAQIRDTQETKRRIGGALTYPIILVFVAVAVVVAMLWFVVPTFAGMFEEMNAELPHITLLVVAASKYVTRYGLYVIGAFGVAAYFFQRYLRTDGGRRRVGAIVLATPMLGDLSVQSAMYRFSSNLALLLKSGMPMLDTLSVMASAFRSNPAYQDAILTAQKRVAAGRPLADSLEESGLFTTMMTNMVRIGEESAELPNVMAQVAPYYKEKINSFLARVTKLLEPCIIMVMGVVIATVMLAIYMPMFEMAGKVN